MTMPAFDYVRPESLDEACAVLERYGPDAMILAGGTDLLVSLKQRVFTPKCVVDIKRLPELQKLEFDEEAGLTVGASTNLWKLSQSEVVCSYYTAISDAALSVAAIAQQTMGTVGGNLCLDTRCWYFNQSEMWRGTLGPCLKMGGDACFVVKEATECYANYSGDTAPAFMAYGAEARIASSHGVRIVPVRELYSGDGKVPIALQSGEILVDIRVPLPRPGVTSAYKKYRLRESVDFPLAGVAVAFRLESDQFADVRVVMTAVGCAPEHSSKVEEILTGSPPTDEVIDKASKAARSQARPLKTTVMPPPHRKRMVEMIVRDAIESAISRCRNGSEVVEAME